MGLARHRGLPGIHVFTCRARTWMAGPWAAHGGGNDDVTRSPGVAPGVQSALNRTAAARTAAARTAAARTAAALCRAALAARDPRRKAQNDAGWSTGLRQTRPRLDSAYTRRLSASAVDGRVAQR